MSYYITDPESGEELEKIFYNPMTPDMAEKVKSVVKDLTNPEYVTGIDPYPGPDVPGVGGTVFKLTMSHDWETKNNNMRELTIGEQFVGVSFNPSQRPEVDRARAICAELIDMLYDSFYKKNRDQITQGIGDMALHQVLLAQMAIVKLLTLPDKTNEDNRPLGQSSTSL
jgi:hypothetical protein